jgi:uncharacterized protein (DUF2237 family)
MSFSFAHFSMPAISSCGSLALRRLEAGQAPRVVLRATHEAALGHCSLADLKRFAWT